MNSSIARVRGVVRYIKQSPTRLAKFKECAASAGVKSKCLLCLDVGTRWNSTFLMLDTALKFQRAFASFELCDNSYIPELIRLGDGVPDDRDWTNVKRISRFLREFYYLTLNVSGTSYITANSFLDSISDMYTTLIEWQNGDDVDLQSMTIKMKEKFDKYWGNVDKMNLVLFIAAILDPRKKVSYVEFTLLDMFKKNRLNTGSNELKTKLEKYLLEPVDDEGFDDDEFDVLMWWKLNQFRFPVLATIARDVLAVPISTVASESALSTGGRVLDLTNIALETITESEPESD
ncbi:zinc finger BED domain-containing protein RICESLEEPER 1-like [Herrania umbratica]|uniref:Zinc finger BED domain-containing protein RICESLEEPER 1-like n=1 Tax=Herrania umbratica TaxID=108875 RepID=A0A6J1B2G6_9ROSI|nr:zinc finger BED domain-containing protein RICESLEEPER 1-like [Herrania umbratica]